MGVMDLIEKAVEDRGESLAPQRRYPSKWRTICVCGHTQDFHAVDIGGEDNTSGGLSPTPGTCRGAITTRNEGAVPLVDGVFQLPATCPCAKFHPIAEIDRPSRLFRQRTYTLDTVHPFERGMKAWKTWLGTLQSYPTEEDVLQAIEDRFRWVEENRVCAVCKKRDDTILPRYVDDARHSQMRCSKHYDSPRG